MAQPSIITKTPSGGYEITTKANGDPLSALVLTPRFASTLWGARRVAREHQRRLVKHLEAGKFREVIR